MKHRAHWYLVEVFFCPVCLRETTTRTRMYTPKPQSFHDRYKEITDYDWCNE